MSRSTRRGHVLAEKGLNQRIRPPPVLLAVIPEHTRSHGIDSNENEEPPQMERQKPVDSVGACENSNLSVRVFDQAGNDLLSRGCSIIGVLGLTAVFGMGTGGTPAL